LSRISSSEPENGIQIKKSGDRMIEKERIRRGHRKENSRNGKRFDRKTDFPVV
jgi:hypothetical protein